MTLDPRYMDKYKIFDNWFDPYGIQSHSRESNKMIKQWAENEEECKLL